MDTAGHMNAPRQRLRVMREAPAGLMGLQLSPPCAWVLCPHSSPLNSLFDSCSKIPSAFIVLEVSCPIPTGIPNGFITFAVMRVHGYKEKVEYGCVDHYVLDGDAEIQCQNTGNWSSKPICRGEWRKTMKWCWCPGSMPRRACLSRFPTTGENVFQLLCVVLSLFLFQLLARLESKEAASSIIPRSCGLQT